MGDTVLLHTIHFKPREDTSPLRVGAILALGMHLGERCGGYGAGILFWEFTRNLDTRKGVELVEVAVFESQEAFDRFRAHPAHASFAEECAQHLNWTVADIMVPKSALKL